MTILGGILSLTLLALVRVFRANQKEMLAVVQWFGPKVPGFELGVRTWQGWLATAIFLALMIIPHVVEFHTLGLPGWTGGAIRIAALLFFVPLFMATCRRN